MGTVLVGGPSTVMCLWDHLYLSSSNRDLSKAREIHIDSLSI